MEETKEETKKKGIGFLPIVLVLGAVVLIVFLLTGQKTLFSNTPPVQILSDMYDNNKVKPQTYSTFYADHSGQRAPVDGTVPRNGEKYPLEKGEFDQADSVIGPNPLEKTNFTLARGKNRYDAFCTPCHNYDGKGNGTVVQKGFQNPPSLLGEVTVAKTDAHIFHIISAGQNIMPGYSYNLSKVDRWAVVHYIREMQAKNPPEQAASTN